MPDEPNLRRADPADIAQTLSHALRFDGRKRVHTAEEMMARITAERLVHHLERSGFIVMRKPPIAGHAAAPGLWRQEE